MESTLWKMLGATKPMFLVATGGNLSFDDNNVFSINIKKGNDSADSGISLNTAEFSVSEEISNLVGARISIALNSYGASLVASLAGNVTEEQIRERFYGRTGIVSIEDQGKFRTTTVNCSSWLAELKKSKYDPPVTVGQKVGEAIRLSLAMGNLAVHYTPVTHGSFDTILRAPEKFAFKDLVSEYADTMGIQVRETPGARQVQIRSIEARKNDVRERSNSVPHITRSAAISPGKYRQSIDDWKRTHRAITVMPDGSQNIISFGFLNRVDKTFVDIQEIDYTNVRRDTGQILDWVRALEFRSSHLTIDPESITVDLLYLLTSDSEHERHQAGYLLSLQAGDPVFFSGDWQGYLRGIYFAQEISETITPDSWLIELRLYPAQVIIGDRMADFEPMPQTWEAAGNLRWNSPEIANTKWE